MDFKQFHMWEEPIGGCNQVPSTQISHLFHRYQSKHKLILLNKWNFGQGRFGAWSADLINQSNNKLNIFQLCS